MIRIAVTNAAFEAISATLPVGSVGFEREPDAKGERLIWLDAGVVDWLAAMRRPGVHSRVCRTYSRRCSIMAVVVFRGPGGVRMKAIYAAAVIAALMALGVEGARATGGCPADPVKASFQVWPMGGLRSMEKATGTHPCGKTLTCYGGNTKHAAARHCEWN